MKYPLRPGMSASVDIYTEEEKDVVSVPIQCVTVREKEDGKSKKKTSKPDEEDESSNSIEDKEYDEVVFVMDADTAKMIKVTTGIQDDEFIMITSELELGLKLISGPYSEVSKNLKSGDRVKLKEEKDKK
jgi:HlyD family secretion protein